MNSNISVLLQPEVYDEDFFDATRDLLTGWAKGNMIPFQYSNPTSPEDPVRGALLWEEFAAVHKDYYQSYEAEPLIEKASNELATLLGHPINALVDIGPGPTRSIEMKSAKLLSALTPAIYKPADVALAYLEHARAFATEKYPHIEVIPSILNIMEATYTSIRDENDFYFIDGSTLLNIPENEETPDVETGLIRNFKNIRQLMADGAYLAFVHDTNQNEASLHKLYRHPIQDAFILNVLHRMARDLPLSQFDASAFSYELVWLPEQHLAAHRAVAQKEQNVILGDMHILIPKGMELQLTHSYKLPADKVIAAARKAGFSPVKSWDDGNERLVFQLFRALPEANAKGQTSAEISSAA